jgi:hypothetical protein
VFLGRGQQVLAVAGAFGGQERVAASDQPLAGVVTVADLGQVLLPTGVVLLKLSRAGPSPTPLTCINTGDHALGPPSDAEPG